MAAKFSMNTVALLLTLSINLGGCTEHPDAHLESAQKAFEHVMSTSSEAWEELNKLSHEDAINQLKKLKQFEYKVVKFDNEISPAALERELNTLGAAMWDCFDLSQRQEKDNQGMMKSQTIAVCKRRPDTPLQYVPPQFLAR